MKKKESVAGGMTSAHVTHLLRMVDPDLSSYSVRHGGMKLLAQCAAAGKIRPATISVLAKHQFDAVMAKTTIRYVQDPMSLAKIHQTHTATKLL